MSCSARAATPFFSDALFSHTLYKCCRNCDDASTGESLGTSAGACHGKMGEVRFTPAYESHDLAEATRRLGLSAPRLRASSPTTNFGSGSHGSAMLPFGKSNSPGM